MIGRVNIERSISHGAMNAWQPQASYPYGNLTDTSFFKLCNKKDQQADISAPCHVLKGKVKPAFALLLYVRFPFSVSWPQDTCSLPRNEGKGQASFCPFVLSEFSVFTELALGHLRYHLTDVPPQSNSPLGNVHRVNHRKEQALLFEARNSS